MTDGCLLTDDVTFKAVISVPPPSSRLPAMRLFASLLLIIIPAETGHAQNYCTSRLLQIGIGGVPLTRVERKCFLSQSAGLAVLDLLVLLAVADVLVVSLPVILPVSERQGLAPCFISLSRRISWKKISQISRHGPGSDTPGVFYQSAAHVEEIKCSLCSACL